MYVVINIELFVVILRLKLFVEKICLKALRHTSIKPYCVVTSLNLWYAVFYYYIICTVIAPSYTRDLQLKVEHRFGYFCCLLNHYLIIYHSANQTPNVICSN